MIVQHRIVWTYEALMGRVDAKVVCESTSDALCQTKPLPGCECEEFFGCDRDEQGWYHVVETDAGELIHRHEPSDECNIALFMNEDPMDTIMEAAAYPSTHFIIGSTLIKPEWNGNGYEWKPIHDPA